MNMLASSTWCFVLVATLGLPLRAYAYSDPRQFTVSTLEAGGGGRFYTGSPADSYGCSTCHTGAEQPTAHIFGVPARYVPRATYEFVVSWPSSIEHASLALELTDERGHGAGSVALPAAGTYIDEEQCQPADGTVLAAQLYAAAPDRTIVAAPDCGASSVRVQWTAPSKSVGPVWLAFGVLSSNNDRNFTGDGATQFTQAIPAFGETVSSRLVSGCDVVVGRQGQSTGVSLGAWVAFGALARRRRRRRRTQALHSRQARMRSVVATGVLLCGCNVDSAGNDDRPVVLEHGEAVPPWKDAQYLAVDAGAADGGKPSDAALRDAEVDAGIQHGDGGCDDADASAPIDASVPNRPPTELSFQVTTLSQEGDYAPLNIGAIWIEDSAGHWVKTLALWASTRVRYLVAYNTANPTHNKVDAITSPTLVMHKVHAVTWNLRDANGMEIANGDYHVRIEVTDKDAAGKSISIDFTKSDQPSTQMPNDQPFFKSIQLRTLADTATP